MGESVDCLASCMLMTWLCLVIWKNLRAIVGRFAEVCRNRGLKVNAGKSRVMILNGEEGLDYEVHVDGVRLKHISEIKYLECVLDKSRTD